MDRERPSVLEHSVELRSHFEALTRKRRPNTRLFIYLLFFLSLILILIFFCFVSECVHELLRLVSFANQQGSSPATNLVRNRCFELVEWFLRTMGVSVLSKNDQNDERANKAAQAAVDIRFKLKEFATTLDPPHKQEGFAISDWARVHALDRAGISVKDTPKSSTWKWK
jgi:cysteinyl-tRNA synthetase